MAVDFESAVGAAPFLVLPAAAAAGVGESTLAAAVVVVEASGPFLAVVLFVVALGASLTAAAGLVSDDLGAATAADDDDVEPVAEFFAFAGSNESFVLAALEVFVAISLLLLFGPLDWSALAVVAGAVDFTCAVENLRD